MKTKHALILSCINVVILLVAMGCVLAPLIYGWYTDSRNIRAGGIQAVSNDPEHIQVTASEFTQIKEGDKIKDVEEDQSQALTGLLLGSEITYKLELSITPNLTNLTVKMANIDGGNFFISKSTISELMDLHYVESTISREDLIHFYGYTEDELINIYEYPASQSQIPCYRKTDQPLYIRSNAVEKDENNEDTHYAYHVYYVDGKRINMCDVMFVKLQAIITDEDITSLCTIDEQYLTYQSFQTGTITLSSILFPPTFNAENITLYFTILFDTDQLNIDNFNINVVSNKTLQIGQVLVTSL